MAHKLAMINEHITADVVEATEFPEMSQRYQIYGVPKTVINDRVSFEGALPEELFVGEVLRALPGQGQETKEPEGQS